MGIIIIQPGRWSNDKLSFCRW